MVGNDGAIVELNISANKVEGKLKNAGGYCGRRAWAFLNHARQTDIICVLSSSLRPHRAAKSVVVSYGLSKSS